MMSTTPPPTRTADFVVLPRKIGAMTAEQVPWAVLLIGGASGVGKSTAAPTIAQRFGSSWLGVDDLRLAFERSHVTLPQGTEALYFFLETPNVGRLPPERLCKGLIGVGEVMSPAIEVIIESHVDHAAPIVIEGDSILPALLTRPSVQDRAAGGRVRAVFVVEPDEGMVLANIVGRGRGMDGWSEEEVRIRARAYWLYGQWLAEEAHRHGLPVVEPRPWDTLSQRIVTIAARTVRASDL